METATNISTFQQAILEGIPATLPAYPADENNPEINHAPRRIIDSLSRADQELALRNALRYFPEELHADLAPEFATELKEHGRIYMKRYRPHYEMKARHIDDFPHQSKQAASIMLMICNNLNYDVAQHPHELITYGGNGSVFQNWAQYRLTMKYLAEMNNQQTLVMYSGHPMGLFPSHSEAPRVVVTNGMMIPQYSEDHHWNRFNALGVTQYGQMTAGSYMYIGPQGIVHGTTITLLNAGRMIDRDNGSLEGKLFITSGLGGMSGAQAKAAVISGAVGVIAEVNLKQVEKMHRHGWINEYYGELDELIPRIRKAQANKEAIALAYHGNIVELWERVVKEDLKVDIGSDQTSLHNPWQGGYYPVDIPFDEAQKMISEQPKLFKEKVQATLRRHVVAIQALTAKGMYFFDYGNAFLKQAADAGAPITKEDGTFIYPSYVQDIMGPMCFDFGFGPFRWVCCSNDPADLRKTDELAASVLKRLEKKAPAEIRQQMNDNIRWIEQAEANELVVGSQARILYADAEGRIEIARAFNDAIATGELSASVVLGRDHHDVSGTDSPFRETSNIYDGSSFTADMAIQNVIGDSFRGATWVSIHNGGGVGWGNVINGGFGMLIDGTAEARKRLDSMLFWDVNNGIARRSWARNSGANFAIQRAMEENPELRVTMPVDADNDLVAGQFDIEG